MNEKKNFYEELYGEISKMKKNQAYIDSKEDYKLNFSFLLEIFGKKRTELYNFFVSAIFGIDYAEEERYWFKISAIIFLMVRS